MLVLKKILIQKKMLVMIQILMWVLLVLMCYFYHGQYSYQLHQMLGQIVYEPQNHLKIRQLY